MDQGIYEEVGRHIRENRRQQGLTLEQLGEISGLAPAYIGQIERDVKKASLETLKRLAKALRLPISKLFDEKVLRILPPSEKIEILLRSSSPRERTVLLSTLRQLALQLKSLR